MKTGKIIVGDGLREALSGFRGPLGFLDFETIALPIPAWDGCHPYDQVPVQFSFDLQTPSGLRHAEWIADGPRDPRPGIAAAVVESCTGAQTILAYNAAFERGCIDRLVEAVPRLAKKLTRSATASRDLLPVVREHVYHPEFHGSFSIKAVHPALTGGDPDGNLAVGDGDAAMTALESLMFDGLAPVEHEALKRSLLDYWRLTPSRWSSSIASWPQARMMVAEKRREPTSVIRSDEHRLESANQRLYHPVRIRAREARQGRPMAIKKSDLYSSLWASCDELRGGMDASQYKDYVLFMLFIKYISDKYGD